MRLIAALALALCLARPAGAVERIAAELHVHSDLSTGEFSLERVAEMAQKLGVSALLLTENYRLRIEYGLPPFRALTRVVHEERSVMQAGPERYLARVAAVRERFPGLTIVPGVEVIPHYYWTGSPLGLDMTLHNSQKNVLVFGLAADALARLPSIGNGGRFTVQSLADLVPALLVIPGVLALSVKRQRKLRLGRAFVIVRRRRWGLGLGLCLVAAVAIVRAWPFSADAYPYWADPGLVPHQDLIDYVHRVGGVSIWSFPEARDEGERAVGPVRVRWRTDPYPDDLVRTFNYTAFGALYEDTTRFERPGEGWDRLLGQYVKGERSRPVWAVAESGFHAFRAGKRLGTVQTVLLTGDRSEAGVLEAITRGRMYALIRSPATGLALEEFAVSDGSAAGASGETLRARVGAPIEVRIGIGATGDSPEGVRLVLVKNGGVVGTWAGTTPFRVVHRETFDGTPTFFRADVRSQPAVDHLLTNPIFVKPS